MTNRRAIALFGLALLASCGEPASSGRAPEPPPFAMSATAVEARSADATYIARWEPEGGAMPDAEPFNMRFSVRRADGAPIPAEATFAVDAEMPHHGHGMNLVPEIRRVGTDGSATLLVASGMLLHMQGRWVLSLDVTVDGILERTQWFVDVD